MEAFFEVRNNLNKIQINSQFQNIHLISSGPKAMSDEDLQLWRKYGMFPLFDGVPDEDAGPAYWYGVGAENALPTSSGVLVYDEKGSVLFNSSLHYLKVIDFVSFSVSSPNSLEMDRYGRYRSFNSKVVSIPRHVKRAYFLITKNGHWGESNFLLVPCGISVDIAGNLTTTWGMLPERHPTIDDLIQGIVVDVTDVPENYSLAEEIRKNKNR